MSESNGNFSKGFFIGGLIGAVIGILYAPKAGRETREELTRKADELLAIAEKEYEKNKEDYETVFERIRDVGSLIKGKASEVEGKISKFSRSSKESVQDRKKRLKKAIKAGSAAYREKQKKKRV
jgi:gas vesicle protein